jgi:hypothetical protein
MGLHSKGLWLQLARRFKWRSVRDIFYHAQTAITPHSVANNHGQGAAGTSASSTPRVWEAEELEALKAAVSTRDGTGQRPVPVCWSLWHQ